jgi:hypothetical protein
MGSFLGDVSASVTADLKQIFCSSLFCVMRDFDAESASKINSEGGISLIIEEASTKDGSQNDSNPASAMSQKLATQLMTHTLTPTTGVNSDTIRRNKAMECLKNIFTHRQAFAIPAPQEGEEASHKAYLTKLSSTIKRKAPYKQIHGKALNGNMVMSLALEFAETLSQPPTTQPGSTRQMPAPVLPILQAFQKVAEEEA